MLGGEALACLRILILDSETPFCYAILDSETPFSYTILDSETQCIISFCCFKSPEGTDHFFTWGVVLRMVTVPLTEAVMTEMLSAPVR